MTKASKFDFLRQDRTVSERPDELQPSGSLRTQKSEDSNTRNAEYIESQVVQLHQPKKKGRPRGKRSNPDYEQVTAYIRKETYKNVKKKLLDDPDGRDFSTLLEELLDRWQSSNT